MQKFFPSLPRTVHVQIREAVSPPFLKHALAALFMMICAFSSMAQIPWDGTTLTPVVPEGSVYNVSTAAELAWIGQELSKTETFETKTIQLTADIDLGGHPWIPFEKFCGTFDGQGYAVRGLKVTNESDYTGFFAKAVSASFKNIKILDCDIKGTRYMGGLVGFPQYTTIMNCTVTGVIEGTSSVGGIVGYAETVMIFDRCQFQGTVKGTSSNIGGLIGTLGNTTYEESLYACFADATVTGSTYVGGLIGYAKFPTVTLDSCLAKGTVIGISTGSNSYIGGLVGRNMGEIQNSGAIGEVRAAGEKVGGLVGSTEGNSSVSNSYAFSTVTGKAYVGGLVGYTVGTTTVDSCYANGTVTGTGNYIGGLTGYNYGKVQNSGANVQVIGVEYVGGLTGRNSPSTTALVENSYASGTVSGTKNAGGVIGYNDAPLKNSYWLRSENMGGVTTPYGGKSSSGPVTDLFILDVDPDLELARGIKVKVLKDNTGAVCAVKAGTVLTLETNSLLSVTADTELLPESLGSGMVHGLLTPPGFQYGIPLQFNVDIALKLSYTVKAEIALTDLAGSAITWSGAMDGTTPVPGQWKLVQNGIDVTHTTLLSGRQAVDLVFSPDDSGNYAVVTLPIMINVAFEKEGSVYWISSREDLDYLSYLAEQKSNKLTASFKVKNDIEMGSRPFTPIAVYSKNFAFKGSFDGNHKVIRNLTIQNPQLDYAALFGYVDGTIFQNVGLEGGNISSGTYASMLCGMMKRGRIENCYVSGNVKGSGSSCSGLVAYLNVGASTVISNSYYIRAEGTLPAIGYGSGNANVLDVSQTLSLDIADTALFLKESKGKTLCGVPEGGALQLTPSPLLTVTADTTLYGAAEGSGIVTAYYKPAGIDSQFEVTLNVSVSKKIPKLSYAVVRIPAEAELQTAIADFTSTLPGTWILSQNEKDVTRQPLTERFETVDLVFTPADPVSHAVVTESIVIGSAFEMISGEWLIKNRADLEFLARLVNQPNSEVTLDSAFKVVSNIEMQVNGTDLSFSPIGQSPKFPFNGNFDGDSKVIRNLSIDAPESSYQGLFGYIKDKKVSIRNVKLENVNISAKNYVGALAGQAAAQIENCMVSGTLKGEQGIGGLIGDFNDGSLTGCSSAVSVSGIKSIGGLAGSGSGSLTGCSASGNISGKGYVGGLCGMFSPSATASWTRAYAAGNVNGTDSTQSSIGGLIGHIQGSSAPLPLSDCYATGRVIGLGTKVGGLVGTNVQGKLQRCYASGSVKGGKAVGGLIGWNIGDLDNCYFSGTVEADSNFDGKLDPISPIGGATPGLDNQSLYLGGLIGAHQDKGNYTACYWIVPDSLHTKAFGGAIGSEMTGELYTLESQQSFTLFKNEETDFLKSIGKDSIEKPQILPDHAQLILTSNDAIELSANRKIKSIAEDTLPKTVPALFKAAGIDTEFKMTFNVTMKQRPLMVTADTVHKIYGETDPAFSYTQLGLFGSDTFMGALARTPGEDAGIYAIDIGTLNAGNGYLITFTPASLIIDPQTKVNVSVTAESLIVTGNPISVAVEVISSGTLLVQNKDYTVDSPLITEAGDYPITITGIGNYRFSQTKIVSITPPRNDDFYLIRNFNELKWFADKVNGTNGQTPDSAAKGKLAGDILIDGSYTPIGALASTPFSGCFDGAGHSIVWSAGAVFDLPANAKAAGLFGYVAFLSNATDSNIKDLKVAVKSPMTVPNTDYLGALVGTWSQNGIQMIRCSAEVNAVLAGAKNIGGLAGGGQSAANRRDLAWFIDDCAVRIGSEGIIGTRDTVLTNSAGGIIGYATAAQNNPCCLRNASIDVVGIIQGNMAGGIHGSGGFNVENCIVNIHGAVSGIASGGGVSGNCQPMDQSAVYGYPGAVKTEVILHGGAKISGAYVGGLVGWATAQRFSENSVLIQSGAKIESDTYYSNASIAGGAFGYLACLSNSAYVPVRVDTTRVKIESGATLASSAPKTDEDEVFLGGFAGMPYNFSPDADEASWISGTTVIGAATMTAEQSADSVHKGCIMGFTYPEPNVFECRNNWYIGALDSEITVQPTDYALNLTPSIWIAQPTALVTQNGLPIVNSDSVQIRLTTPVEGYEMNKNCLRLTTAETRPVELSVTPIGLSEITVILDATVLLPTVIVGDGEVLYSGTPSAPSIACDYPVADSQITFNGIVTNSAVLADSYNVLVSPVNGMIFSPESKTSGVWIIRPALGTVSVSALEAVYDGKEHAVTVTVDPAEAPYRVIYQTGTTQLSGAPIHAGHYTATVVSDSVNYAWEPVSTSILLSQASPEAQITVVPISYGQTLGEAVSALTVNGVDALPLSGTLDSHFDPDAVPHAGTVELTWEFIPNDAQNYSNMTFSRTITVNPVAPTLIFEPFRPEMVVGVDPKTLYVRTNSTGEITYSSTDPAILSVDAQSGQLNAVGAGTAAATASIAAAGNYTSFSVTSSPIKVYAEMQLTIADTTVLYSSAANYPTIADSVGASSVTPRYTFINSAGVAVDSAWAADTYRMTVSLVQAGTSPVTITDSFIVQKAPFTATVSGETFFRYGEVMIPALTQGAWVGNDNPAAFHLATALTTESDSGIYPVNIAFDVKEPAVLANYAILLDTLTVTVSPRPLTFRHLNTHVVYTGSSIPVSVHVDGLLPSQAAMQSDRNLMKIGTGIDLEPTVTEIGTYPVGVKIVDGNKFSIVGSHLLTLDLGKIQVIDIANPPEPMKDSGFVIVREEPVISPAQIELPTNTAGLNVGDTVVVAVSPAKGKKVVSVTPQDPAIKIRDQEMQGTTLTTTLEFEQTAKVTVNVLCQVLAPDAVNVTLDTQRKCLVTWEPLDADFAVHYTVYRRPVGASVAPSGIRMKTLAACEPLITLIGQTSFIDSTIRPGEQVQYAVTAASDESGSELSDYAQSLALRIPVDGIYLWNGALVDSILAEKIDLSSLDTTTARFVSKPKIHARYEDPFKPGKVRKLALNTILDYKQKINTANPDSLVRIECLKNVQLYNKQEFRDLARSGRSVSDFIKSPCFLDSILISDVYISGTCRDEIQPKIKLPQETRIGYAFLFRAPIITGGTQKITIPDTQDSAIVLNTDAALEIEGWFFGKKLPKVWIEYPDSQAGKMKKLPLRVLKSYDFQDRIGNDNKSCTDVRTGRSVITVKTPDHWNEKMRLTQPKVFTLVIDNGSGLAVFKVWVNP